jgi:hypothetical protein
VPERVGGLHRCILDQINEENKMNSYKIVTKPLMWFMALLLVAVAAGCSSGSSGGGAAANSAKDITAYSLGGTIGTINQVAKTITVVKPSGTGVTALVATFVTSGASVKVGTSPQTSGVTFNNFTSPVVYTVTAVDGTTVTYTVSVTVSAVANPTTPTLGEAGRYVILASQSVTTTPAAAGSIRNGDIGNMDQVRAAYITGFTQSGLGGDFVELTGGSSYAMDDVCNGPGPFTCPLHFSTPVVGAAWASAGTMITQVRTDLGIAYSFLAGTNPTAPTTTLASTELGGVTLPAGVYYTASPLGISTGPLHLDAQGDPNAVWIFSTDQTFTTAGAAAGSIDFVGGVGQAKNVFWRVAGITTIGAGSTFLGNVYGYANVNVLSAAIITGSLHSTTASVTLIADMITKAP